MLEDDLCKLYKYLISNGYKGDANQILEIKESIKRSGDKNSLRRLIAMCNPRYLGDLVITDFDDVYQWWNFLRKISEGANKQL